MSRVKRLGRYASWAMIDQAVGIGLPRLVLFPILATMLGDRAFGTFVIALGLIQIVGLSPSNGLVAFVIRDLSHRPASDQPIMVRTVMLLSLAAVGPIALAFMFAAARISLAYESADFLLLIPGLAVFLILTNLVEASLSALRVARAFDCIALVHFVQAAILFSSIPLYHTFGLPGIAIGYVLAGTCALAASLLLRRDLRTGRLMSLALVGPAVRVWIPFSVSSFITLSAGYLDRVLLGYWWSPADVAPFFAAASTAAIFIMPSTFVSNLILSLLGKVRERKAFDRAFYVRYAAATMLFSVVVYFVGAFIGPFILRILYPSFLADAAPLWPYAIGAFSVMSIQAFTRPFVCKFLAPGWLPVLSGVGLVARVVPLLVLVPKGGAHGAVTALLIGSAVTSLVWMMAFANAFMVKGGTIDLDACGEPSEG